MKILYVEDELSKHIDTILKIFSQLLGQGLKKELKALMDDESGRAASPEEIKEIIGKNNMLDICDSFPEALKIVTNFSDDYDLFIVDRNLAEMDYDLNEVEIIDPNFTEQMSEKYFDREGDWLLNILSDEIDTRNQFYFLTAYTDDDIIIEKNSSLSEQGRFHKDQVIKKGELDQLAFLKKKIKEYPSVKIRIENQDIIDILNSKIGSDAENDFIQLARNSDKHEYLNQTRQFFENRIIRTLANREKVPEEECFKTFQRGEEIIVTDRVDIKGFINWVNQIIFKKDDQGNFILDDTNNRQFDDYHYELGSNGIIKGEMHTILQVCHPGSHNSQSDITQDTVSCVFYALKDIIRWFGKID